MNLLRIHIWTAALAISAWVAADTAAADSSPAESRYDFAQVLMGMEFKLTFYAAGPTVAKQAADAAFDRVRALNSILSDYDPASELSRLSRTAGQNRWVGISPELWLVLSRAQLLARQTGGAFDVTVGPLTRLWRRSRRQRELPSAAQLNDALAAVGYRHLQLDPQTGALLQRSGMRLDLGGIAAGYAVDEALRILHKHGVARALVDASGDIAAADPPPGQSGWRIEIDFALEKESQRASPELIELKHAAVTTAGDTAQFVEIDGRRYSHIVDPTTGLGLTRRIQVIVIAPDCITADSLDTAASVLGPERGLELISSTPGAQCRIVTGEPGQTTIHDSPRFKDWLAKSNPAED